MHHSYLDHRLRYLLCSRSERSQQCCGFSSSDAWVGEFQRATSGLSTSDAAKKSANAVFEVPTPQQFILPL